MRGFRLVGDGGRAGGANAHDEAQLRHDAATDPASETAPEKRARRLREQAMEARAEARRMRDEAQATRDEALRLRAELRVEDRSGSQ